MPRLFTPSLAKKYEELYQDYGVKFVKVSALLPFPIFQLLHLDITPIYQKKVIWSKPKENDRLTQLFDWLSASISYFQGASIKNLEVGSDGRVAGVKLGNGSTIEADTVIR